MKFAHFRNLNKNEKYPTSKYQLKLLFSDIETLRILFGLNRKFEFDSRCSNKPNIKGVVVASISYHRDRTVNFSLYPLSINDYPEKAVEDFNNVILLDIQQWLKVQIDKPETALLGIEQLVVEWNGNKHLFHSVKFL
jgi:hypothetical protein